MHKSKRSHPIQFFSRMLSKRTSISGHGMGFQTSILQSLTFLLRLQFDFIFRQIRFQGALVFVISKTKTGLRSQFSRVLVFVTPFSRHLVFDVLFYEMKDCPLIKGDRAINSLSLQKCRDTLKDTFVERSTQYMSFSPRKQPKNTGIERKQFTDNASEALQQTILTHAHTKCPPVGTTDTLISWFL